MVISTFNNPAVDFSPNYQGAEVAAAAINKAGGIGGHQVVIDHCSDQFTSNIALACARNAVSEHAIATVADESSFGDVINPVLTQAKIPAVAVEAESAADWSSPAAFPITASLPWSELMIVAKQHHMTNVGWAYINSPGAQGQELAAESNTTGPLGIKIVASPAISLTATNFTNYAQQLKSAGAQAVVLELATGQIPSLINAANSIGYHPMWLGASQVIGPAGFKTMGAVAEGISLAEELPPYTATSVYPALKTWDDQISAAGMTGVTNINDANAENGWLGVWAIKKFYDQEMQGKDLTGPALYDALTSDTTKPVDLFGILSWTPGASGPTGYGRVANSEFWPSHVANSDGTIVLDSPTPVNFFATIGLK
jgi:ABC-type branched-subunit amino acid transport system substrate-binding protein